MFAGSGPRVTRFGALGDRVGAGYALRTGVGTASDRPPDSERLRVVAGSGVWQLHGADLFIVARSGALQLIRKNFGAAGQRLDERRRGGARQLG